MAPRARSLSLAGVVAAAVLATTVLTIGSASAAGGLPSSRTFDYDCGTSRAAVLHLRVVGDGTAGVDWRGTTRVDHVRAPANVDLTAPNGSGTVDVYLSPRLLQGAQQAFIAFDNSTNVSCDVHP